MTRRAPEDTLQELLDKRLLERQARETGICPVREDLYQQCFDELIRQVTLDGPERGLLLLRVRDEIRMTIDAYKILVREIFSAYLPACVRVCNRLSYLMPTP